MQIHHMHNNIHGYIAYILRVYIFNKHVCGRKNMENALDYAFLLV